MVKTYFLWELDPKPEKKKTGAGQEQTGSATLLIGFRTKLCLIIFWYRYGEVARSEAKCTGTGIQQL